jgi:hypothetical protein
MLWRGVTGVETMRREVIELNIALKNSQQRYRLHPKRMYLALR